MENIKKFDLYSEAKILEDAIKLGIIHEDPYNSNNILVVYAFDNGEEKIVSINKLEAVISLIKEGQVEMLAEEVKKVKEYGYSKNINSFIKNITIKDVDVYNKLNNLIDGVQISEDVFRYFKNNEKLQNILAEKIIHYIKTNENAGDELQTEMVKFSQWYDEDDLKEFDYSDALYNCDSIYLEMMSECLNILVSELSTADMNIIFDSYIRNIANNDVVEEER